jgi:hypothetical protein
LTQEFDGAIQVDGVLEAIKNEAGATQAELVVIVMKEKLSTPRLIQ